MEIDVSLLEKNLQIEIKRVGLISSRSILEKNESELLKLGNFTNKDIKNLKYAASLAVIHHGFKTVKELEGFCKDKWRCITLDSPEIDALLGGGIPVRQITEISGISGVGKTQFGLQLSVTVQYPISYGGLGKGAVYICTEDKFPSKRLNQMLSHFPRKSEAKERLSKIKFGDYIYVDHIADVEGLKECVNVRLANLLHSCEIGLIVLDSIAAVYRTEYSHLQSVSRAQDIRDVGIQLHKLARNHNIAVLCINQVTDTTNENGDGGTVPALGLAWANLVTTKLKLTNDKGTRILNLLSAPHLPPSSVPYVISNEGIFADL